MNILRNKKFHNILWAVLWITAVFATSYSFAAQRVVCCDYISINGDFQSYNVFRRMLDGQTPYVDFSNYIGMAPVFVNLPFVALENTFANSLFVTNFTSNVVFCLSVFILFRLITGHTGISCLISALIPKLVETQILLRFLGTEWGTRFTDLFRGIYTPSNSMRGVRSFLPFLLVIVAVVFKYAYKAIKKTDFEYIKHINKMHCIELVGAVQGLLLVWSNDFGIACLAAFFVMYLFVQIFAYKDKTAVFIRNVAVWLGCALAGMIVSATAVTKAPAS